MSSKEQFRDALKRDKLLKSNMNKEIKVRDQHVIVLEAENLRLKLQLKTAKRRIANLQTALLIDKKKWWQFWK